MPCTLIVLAHPEKQSFNSSWAQASAQASQAEGHEVMWSDLYALNFDPSEKADNYASARQAGFFDVLKAQEAAADTNSLPEDVAQEIAKIRAADRIIFHFPIWWFAPPAILKGWCDRVFVQGALHTIDQRFDNGIFRGKTVLFCATTGANSAESAFNGKEGDVRMLLWPLAYTLRYIGFDVLEPRVLHGIHGYHEGANEVALKARLTSELEGHAQTIAQFESLPKIAFNADTEFDAEGSLLPDAPSYSHFIRQKA
ncbi:NAD(P)H-dependent oxidoreductase [Falsihalocynthiibacter sp. S25ZX9]|uniref:NAD(P)H-dependent oxidoreductase n=1 Tax=Falsihalocynthiibacter sp. S25ZX9 TaxID=3240870 RepID=UPI00351062C5